MKDKTIKASVAPSDNLMETVMLRLPKSDLTLLKALTKKMGWLVQKPTAYEQSIDDIRQGRVSEYNSVDEFFKDVLK